MTSKPFLQILGENEEILPLPIRTVWHRYSKDAPSVWCAYLLTMIKCNENVAMEIGQNPDSNANIENEKHLKLSPLQYAMYEDYFWGIH